MKALSDNALRRIAQILSNDEEKIYSLEDPELIYIGDFAKELEVGRTPGKNIGYPTVVTAYLCPSDGPGKPEVIDIIGARSAHGDYDEGKVEYLDLIDGRTTNALYVFPLTSKPEYLLFEDEYGTFHNWAAFKDVTGSKSNIDRSRLLDSRF